MRTSRLFTAHSAIVVAAIGWLSLIPLSGKGFSDWSSPENVGAAVNSVFNEQHPALSRDGSSLYFVSDRPGGLGGFDLYVSQRRDGESEWGTPVAVEALNSPASEFAPAFDPDGHMIFFGSERPGGCGGRDLWMSFRRNKRDDFGWEPPVNLGCIVNSPGFDDGPTLFEDETSGLTTLYFISNRPGGRGDRDIWTTTRSSDGSFSLPVNVTELNSAASDSRPAIARNGLEIFFTSQRTGSVPLNGVASTDLWSSFRRSAMDPWSTPVNVAALNSNATDAAPALSRDRATLFFNSDRPGGFGALDLYVSLRTRTKGN